GLPEKTLVCDLVTAWRIDFKAYFRLCTLVTAWRVDFKAIFRLCGIVAVTR
ncbi:unnamed protein product, partial [marine sediment metagenome]